MVRKNYVKNCEQEDFIGGKIDWLKIVECDENLGRDGG